MAKILAGVVAVSIAALLFAGCAGGSNTAPVESSTSTTAAKTVVSTFCGEKKQTLDGDSALSGSDSFANIYNGTPIPKRGHIYYVWSDGSTTETAGKCIQ
jgi:hypothetical protein